MLRVVDLLVGKFENFRAPDTGKTDLRLLMKAWLRISGSLPIYAGVLANVGQGEDDLRLVAALQLDLNRLVGAIPAP